MPIAVIDNLTGGLNLRDPQLLKNNQFEELLNFGYDQDKRLKTRLGYKKYFQVIPDTVVTIDNLDATTGWNVSGDAANLTAGTAIRGNNSLSFDIVKSGTSATLTKTTLSANISTTKSHITFWLYVPAAFNTNLTNIKFRLGNDSSNYYEWTLGTLTVASNNFIRLDFADSTVTGTVNDALISYGVLEVNYASTYTSKSGIKFDNILAYSTTYTKPVTSYFSNRNEANLTNITICVSGDNMFILNEVSQEWELIDSGLTQFETQTGKTTHRTRWEFFAYNGAGTMEIGMCDGVNDYRVWNGTKTTIYASQPKCRYFLVHEDTIYSTGEDAHPLTLYYTGASPSDNHTLNTNNLDVGNEADGRNNGLFALATSVMIGKTERIYYFDVVSSACLPLDVFGGMFSQRAISQVGYGVLYQTKNSIDNLAQKTSSTGQNAVVGESYSADLSKLISKINANNWNSSCGVYIKELNNYYFSFDTNGDNIPDTTLVYNSLVGKTWSQYTYPSAYSYGIYIDSNNEYNYLMASAVAGIIYKIENEWKDETSNIQYSFTTKAFDFKNPYNWKDFEYITLSGYKNEGSSGKIEVLSDNNVVYVATIDDNYITSSSSLATIGSDPIGSRAIGGSGEYSEGIAIYPYQIRLAGELFATGQIIKIKFSADSSPLVMTFDRFEIKYALSTDDLFPAVNFA